MGMLDATQSLRQSGDAGANAAKELETLVLKQLLASSGAFRGGEAAGSQVWGDVLAEAVAASVAQAGGIGLGSMLAAALPQIQSSSTSPPEVVPGSPLPQGEGRVTSGFGLRTDPLSREARFHEGVDWAAPRGTPILSAADGVVVWAGPRGGYGHAVEVSHADGTTSLYAHAEAIGVNVGQRVRRGEELGTVGSTGRSTGDHLHFELRRQGHAIDPCKALQRYGSRAETKMEKKPGEDRLP